MVRKILFVGLCLVFFISLTCSAEEKKDEWQEKAFNFTTIKTVLIQLSANSDITINDDDNKKLDDLLNKQISQSSNQRVHFISPSQLEDNIGKLINTDIEQLRVDDNAKYYETLREYAPLVADAVLKINIKALTTTQVAVPKSTRSYVEFQTTYVSVPIFLPRGGTSYTTKAVQVPVTRYTVVPAHNDNVGHAGVEFTLETCNNQQKVWSLLDMREGTDKKPLEMTEHIFQRAIDRFRAITN
ncbi:MAG: hypothetical protein H6Q74_2762 [Firmicutes bacterium]|nr:hypothetical protein [Bacillota bacterium]